MFILFDGNLGSHTSYVLQKGNLLYELHTWTILDVWFLLTYFDDTVMSHIKKELCEFLEGQLFVYNAIFHTNLV